MVSIFAGHGQYFLPDLVTDIRMMAEHAGNGGRRHSGQFGDFLYLHDIFSPFMLYLQYNTIFSEIKDRFS